MEGMLKLIGVLISSIVLSKSSFRGGRAGRVGDEPSRAGEAPVIVKRTSRPTPIPAAQPES